MKKLFRILTLVLVLLLISGVMPCAAYAEEAENDDYPQELKEPAKDALVDPWRFYNRECTSFVAWRLNKRNGVAFDNGYGGVIWGNAANWSEAAQHVGLAVDDQPAVGAVAFWQGGYAGHVAWVVSCDDGSIWVEEYNRNSDGAYHLRCVDKDLPDGYIHIRDLEEEPAAKAVVFTVTSVCSRLMVQ